VDTPSLLAISKLSISFGGLQAVDELSLTIAPGQTLGLVGESGSGKSAASLALLRLLPTTARVTGSVRFAGEELLTLPEAAMRRHRGRSLAMVFQEPMTALNPVMRVGAQIAEALQAHEPGLSRKAVRARVVEALDEVALPNPEARLDDYPHQFSGGQRQRLLIAMALIHRPRLLIADEPTTALDVTVQAQVLALLGQLRRTHNLAMLFISHDLAVVAQACDQPGDQVAVMRQGRLVETGPAREMFLRPQHPYTRRLLASVPTMRTDRTQPLATLA
jgi:peptide/nickel transport system ATP-binding protein